MSANSVDVEYKWDPTDVAFAEHESAVTMQTASVAESEHWAHEDCVAPHYLNSPELFGPSDLVRRLISAVYVSLDDDGGDGLESDEGWRILALSSSDKETVLTKGMLARRWGIGLKAADNTLRVTTQRGIRTFLNPMGRRLSTHTPHLAFPVSNKTMYSDTLFLKVKSHHQNTTAQVWTDGQGYSLFYPIKSKAEAWTTVLMMVNDLNAIPKVVVTDGANEEKGGGWKKEMPHYRIKQKWLEPYSQWQNKAESEIRELKRLIRRTMHHERTPKRLWEHCGMWAAAIRCRMALEIQGLNGITPDESVSTTEW
jgi:hypothetical protein